VYFILSIVLIASILGLHSENEFVAKAHLTISKHHSKPLKSHEATLRSSLRPEQNVDCKNRILLVNNSHLQLSCWYMS